MYIKCKTISKLWVKNNLESSCMWPILGTVKQSLYRPCQALWVPGAPTFHGNRHVKVVRLSALSAGLLYPQEIFLVLISFRDWVDPRNIVRPEGIYQWKIPGTPSGTREFPACSTMPQPTAPPRAPPAPIRGTVSKFARMGRRKAREISRH